MRKISLILLSMGALLALSFSWHGPASAQDAQMQLPAAPTGLPEDMSLWDWTLGCRIAGSYYDEFMHYPDGGDPWPGTGVLTFGADGTLTWSSVGPVGDQAGGGTWERSGWREVTATVLIMGFTPDPIIEDEGGNLVHSHSHVWTGRSRIIFEFDDDFQAATGDGCTDVFWPADDPLSNDPNAPFYKLPYVEHTCRKINVVPCALDEG
jgi:hypothetical protein